MLKMFILLSKRRIKDTDIILYLYSMNIEYIKYIFSLPLFSNVCIVKLCMKYLKYNSDAIF